jgi:hypothetical protein
MDTPKIRHACSDVTHNSVYSVSMQDFVIVTAADSRYFHSLLTLLTTNFHRNSPNTLIHVWDLGFTDEQRTFLNLSFKLNIQIHKVSELGKPPFRGAFNAAPRSFTWKPWIIYKTLLTHDHVLWLDSGVAVCNKLSYFNALFENEGNIFFKNNDYVNLDYTSRKCANLMQASSSELFSPQAHGNVLGFTKCNSTLNLVEEWSRWMSSYDVAVSEELHHRHDQSVLSILLARNSVELLDSSDVILESNSFQLAVESKTQLLAHRRRFNWIDYNSILDLG